MTSYDRAQAHAYLTGEPVPALPAGEHPDDLLNDEEVGALLHIEPSTVRSYAARGYLSPGKNVCNIRVWPRRDIENRQTNPPGQGKGGGRPQGTGRGPRKDNPYEGDPRLDIAAAALGTAGDTPRNHTAAALANQHGGSTRTWERLLTQVAPVMFFAVLQWGRWPPGPVWLCPLCRTNDLEGGVAGSVGCRRSR